jgi:hypothetical protein
MHRLSPGRHLILVVALLGLVITGSPPVVAAATAGNVPSAPLPVLAVLPAQPSPGSVIITGRNFTPGGAVYVALYSPWGKVPFASDPIVARWVIASPTRDRDERPSRVVGRGTVREVFGPAEGPGYRLDGHRDPAGGWVPGTGVGKLCGPQTMARAYDQETNAWSELVPVPTGC